MSPGVLIDNDVLIKIAAYGLTKPLADVTTVGIKPPSMLGVGRFVVRDRLARTERLIDCAAALACFDALLPKLRLLEPSDEELAVAAEFEAAATRENFELDSGESQLLAILLLRNADLLVTGDKRAISAIGLLAANAAQGKVACFEQLVATLVLMVGADALRQAVCNEPDADKAVTICCSCRQEVAPATEDILAAIASYTNHVRGAAAGTLVCSDDLSALTA